MEGEAQFRFPPPQFESGHQLPVTQMPGPRAPGWEYVDLAVLVGALGLATWLIYRKRSRKGVVGLSIFSLLYFGFIRKGCICSIGSVQNVALGLFDSRYAVPFTALAFFLLPLGFALFSGRSFCAGVCPHGALQDLVLLRPLRVPPWLDSGLSILPFIYLGAGVLFAATGSAFLICQYDPFVPLFRMNGRAVMVTSGIVLVALGTVVGRPYCRFLCPYGALLKIGSAFSKWRVRVTPSVCTQCRLCENSCPFGVIQPPGIASELTNGAGISGKEPLPKQRRRLFWLMLLLLFVMTIGGAIGFRFSHVAAGMHPVVKLARVYVENKDASVKVGALSPDDLALERARLDSAGLLAEAAKVENKFKAATTLFGLWVGLVIGLKLITVSIRRDTRDYEPDRGGCFGCARCFADCPSELVRRGVSFEPRIADALVAMGGGAK